MSGIETVKLIVNAEKQAAKMIEDATTRAAAIRRRIDSLIQEQRQETLAQAKKEAAAITAEAEEDGRAEAEQYEKDSTKGLQSLIARALAKKDTTVEDLVTMMMQVEK
jgi:vacuolar-type H+-ATPase subunit H